VDGDLVLEGEVLAELEGLEAVDDQGTRGRGQFPELQVQEHAVAAEAGEVSVDGRRRDVEAACDLAVAAAGDGGQEDLREQVGASEPVGGAEGLSTEGASAVEAEVPLVTLRGVESEGEADLLVGPVMMQAVVVLAVGVGTEGWFPLRVMG
jgi:hypothetical protein